MTEHEITRTDIRHVTTRYEYDGDEIQEKEVVSTMPIDNSVPQYNCKCGEDDMTLLEAQVHMEEQYARVAPETFEEVANAIYHDETVRTGIRENGFVVRKFTGRGNKYCVGMHEQDDTYILMFAMKGSETINRGDPKLKTRENEYVKCELKRSGLPNISEVDEDNLITYLTNLQGFEKVDTGYVGGYRVTPLSTVLSDLFKWYDQ